MRRRLALLAALATSATGASAASAAPTVSISGPQAVRAGQTFVVRIRVDGARVASLGGRLTFAPGALEAVGAAPAARGEALRPAPATAAVAVAAYRLRGRGRAGRDLMVVFTAKRTGRIVIRLHEPVASDGAGRSIALAHGRTAVTVRVGRGSRLLTPRRPLTRPATRGRPRADLNGDGAVDDADLAELRADFDATGGGACGTGRADATGDGCLDARDLQFVLAHRRASTTRTTQATVPMTFTVTSTGDGADATPGDLVCAAADGTCTLRAAITEANYHQGEDTIVFALAGNAPRLIQLTSRLPLISSSTGGVTIDAYTQPGARPNTDPLRSNAIPGIEVRGVSVNAGNEAFYITSADNVLRGFAVSNVYRAVVVDTVNARRNRIVGNWFGYTGAGVGSQPGRDSVLVNAGASDTVIGAPTLADRNVLAIGRQHGVDQYGADVLRTVIQNNLIGVTPTGAVGIYGNVGIDHNFGPKHDLIGGTGPLERNVIAGTNLNGVEFSHGWNPALPARQDNSEQFVIRGGRVLSNYLGFTVDGAYDPAYRTSNCAKLAGCADNGQAVNIYDGVYDTTVEGNWLYSNLDGVQLMAPNSGGTVIRGNHIGVSPLGQAAPMLGWGVRLRWATANQQIVGNDIHATGLGGVGLVEDTVTNVRISRNTYDGGTGLPIDLVPTGALNPNDAGDIDGGANSGLNFPEATSTTTAAIVGSASAGATIEVFRSTSAAGAPGTAAAFLGSTVADATGRFTITIPSLAVGDTVALSQIAADGNTSEISPTLPVGPPPVGGSQFAADVFARTVTAGLGAADLGGTWSLTGTAADFATDGSAATITTPIGAAREARLDGVFELGQTLTASVALGALPVGGNAHAYVVARAAAARGYRAQLRVTPTGAVYAQVRRFAAGVETSVAAEVLVTGVTAAPSVPLRVRFEATGNAPTDLRLKVWSSTDAEPATWTTTAQDATAELQTPGGVGLRTYLSRSATSAVTFRFDDLDARRP